jgi:5-methylcytosine-specific restriction endonuclease McrA
MFNHSWSLKMIITESNLRKIIRTLLTEAFDINRDYPDSADSIHAFHGAGMSNDDMKFKSKRRPGPQFEKEGPVTSGEIKHALNYLAKHKPENLVVYSRGSAVWAAAQDAAGTDDMPELPDSIKQITYLAPAAKRPSWGQQSNSVSKHGNDEVIASVSDGRVPVSQAAKIAQELGAPLTLYKPSRMNSYLENGEVPSDAKTYGGKGHTQPLHWNGDGKTFSGGDLSKIIKDFPDWGGNPAATKEEIEDQENKAAEMMEIRKLIRDILLEKREVKCPLLPNGKRDYKCEYRKYGGADKKNKLERAARNRARKKAEKMGIVRKGDGMELDHIKPLSLGGSNDQTNWQVMSRKDNRRKGKKWNGKSGS